MSSTATELAAQLTRVQFIEMLQPLTPSVMPAAIQMDARKLLQTLGSGTFDMRAGISWPCIIFRANPGGYRPVVALDNAEAIGQPLALCTASASTAERTSPRMEGELCVA